MHERFSSAASPQTAEVEPKWLRTSITMSRNLGALPEHLGQQVELFPDYKESIAAMTAEVEQGRSGSSRGVLHHRPGTT